MQIVSIIENSNKIFTICDVKKYVKVWREQHACEILKVFGEVFDVGDIPVISQICRAQLVKNFWVLWIGMKFMMTQVCFQ